MEKTLATFMTPKSLSDIIGQKHLVGKGAILYNLVQNKKLFSMILYGPPGIGKTSIANAIIKDLGMRYRSFNAVVNNKKDLDIIIEEAKMYGEMVVIIDEIHRLNKDKQDILLPLLESGLLTVIGMTTSNPYYKINPAIRSRCHIFELKELSYEDILDGLNRSISTTYLDGISIDEESLKYIASLAGSDLRYAFNLLELAYFTSTDHVVTLDFLKQISNKPVLYQDKNEDGHYDMLSAFQKSIRGSDVDAAMHYLARLIEAGDLDSIYRRMSVIAFEDIGLANPDIGSHVMAAIQAAELVGLPEARIPLGTVVCEMALSPKSNTAHLALDSALADIEIRSCGKIPSHIKTNSKDYKYPHNFPGSYVVQQYLPDNLKNCKYYFPKDAGYEKNFKAVYDKIEKLKNEEKK